MTNHARAEGKENKIDQKAEFTIILQFYNREIWRKVMANQSARIGGNNPCRLLCCVVL
jgi:hypothetical protein